MLNIVQTVKHKDRTYHLADTEAGKILYFQFGDYTQHKNLTQHEVFWNITKTDEFELLYSQPIVRTISCKKMKDMRVVHKVKVGDSSYHVLEKTTPDGFYYVVDHTHMRIFSEKKYPNMKYIYQIFHKDSLKKFDYNLLYRTFEEETAKFNGDYSASPYVMSTIMDEVIKLAQTAEAEHEEVMQIALF